jgi:hypothetical protein
MSNDKDKIEISHETREFIVDTLVEPYYKDMVKTTINGKKWWRNLGISFETASKVMVALGGIFSFSAGYYHDDTLSFVSGSISCMSLAFLQIASFSYKENKKQGDELNILLKKLKLDTVPSMPRSEDQSAMYSSRESPRRAPDRGLTRQNSFPRQNSFSDPINVANLEGEMSPPFPPPVPPSMQHVSFANPLVEETTLHELGNQIISKEKYIVRQNEHINALEEEIILMRKSILHLMEENNNKSQVPIVV